MPGWVRVRPVRLGRVGALYVPEGDSRVVVELVEPIRGYRYAVLRPTFLPHRYGDVLLVHEDVIVCLLPEPW